MFNQVNLIGNLTRDPELRYSQSGTAIAKLGLALNSKRKNGNGELVEDTVFVDVDSFGKTAETACQYLRKGRQILITGRLKLDQWEDKQTGQKRSRLGIVADRLQFLGTGDNRRGESTTNSDHTTRYGSGGTEIDKPPAKEDFVPF